MLESLRHPNIIPYHHSWLESCQFSAFGPKVPTLHVLMQWAEGGRYVSQSSSAYCIDLFIHSLDDFIEGRLGRSVYSPHLADEQQADSSSPDPPHSDVLRSRSARIRAFREQQHKKKEDKPRAPKSPPLVMKAVHLLSAEEVKSLFSDVTEGLAFLVSVVNFLQGAHLHIIKHEKSILHLDLKPGNVLLTWDQGKLMYVIQS